MTELEAQALAARLTRIWRPEQVTLHAFGKKGLLNWAAQVQGNVFIAVNLYRDGYEFQLFYQAEDFVAKLCVTDDGDIEAEQGGARPGDVERRELIDQFAPQWLPYFRRGCWLSGLPIEASAHEKAEWMRGFTREELEAWNLKF